MSKKVVHILKQVIASCHEIMQQQVPERVQENHQVINAHVLIVLCQESAQVYPPTEGNTITSVEFLATIPYPAPKSDQQTLTQLWFVITEHDAGIYSHHLHVYKQINNIINYRLINAKPLHICLYGLLLKFLPQIIAQIKMKIILKYLKTYTSSYHL